MDAALDLGSLLAEAFARHESGDVAGAMALYRRVLGADPRDAAAHKGLGVALCQTGALGRGTRMLRRACELDPEDAENWTNLANACLAGRDSKGCKEASLCAVALDPKSAVAHNNLAAALRAEHDLDGSHWHAKEAVRLAPDFAQAHLNLGAAYQGAGATREARRCFAEAARLDPQEAKLSEGYLFALQYDESVSPEETVAAHRAWGASRPAPPRLPMRQKPDTVGFVSGDFRVHPVGRFMLPFLREFCPGRRVVLYSNNPRDDAVTDQFRALPVVWRDIVGLDAGEAAARICQDRVDVLFDLGGLSASNRLDVFAERAAPMQVTWLGYSSTTGLPTMDWFLGDGFVFPDGAESLATERLGRLETAFLVDELVPVKGEWKPEGDVRIGVTNNPAKLSDGFLSAVARVLAGAPEARVVFKYGSVDCELVRRRVRQAMDAAGVSADRVEFVGALPLDEHRAFLAGLDFCLDSFPYNGATTTMDALQAGTPVVTLAGRSYASRMTGSLLTRCGSEGMVTRSADAFVRLAVTLASDDRLIAGARKSLVAARRDSVLFDARRFAAAFASAVAEMWETTRP